MQSSIYIRSMYSFNLVSFWYMAENAPKYLWPWKWRTALFSLIYHTHLLTVVPIEFISIKTGKLCQVFQTHLIWFWLKTLIESIVGFEPLTPFLFSWRHDFPQNLNIYGALCDLVSFVQFKKHEKHSWS